MKQIFATWLFEKEQGNSLQKMGARHRLLSYFHTTGNEHEIETYVTKGKQNENKEICIVRNPGKS